MVKIYPRREALVFSVLNLHLMFIVKWVYLIFLSRRVLRVNYIDYITFIGTLFM